MTKPEMINLWLDDIRPAPEGWLHVKTIADAKLQLESGRVFEASLDHDLGACVACLNGKTPEQWLHDSDYTNMPNCEHFGTGYQLVCWMEETGHWPQRIRVHSANPVGRENMMRVITREIQRQINAAVDNNTAD